LGFAEPRKRYSKCFARQAILNVRTMSIEAAAQKLKVSWHTVDSILQEYIARKYSKAKLKGLRRIGIDETFIGKTKKYITVVVDLDTGDPVFVGKGKSEEALAPFWAMLGPRRRKKLEAVAIDMGTAFQKAVRENVPQALVVFDHFHVVKLMNDRIDRLRRRVFSYSSMAVKNVIKGCRYLLMTNSENLDKSRNEDQKLKRLLDLNTPLTAAYILKESLRLVWLQGDREKAKAFLESWIGQARATGIGELLSMAKTLEKCSEGVLNYYLHAITTACLEGINNKIKALIRRAYGFRNLGNFMRLVLAIREFSPAKLMGAG
jgi:transposase